MKLDEINRLIEDERYDEALSALDKAIEEHQLDACLWYTRGKLYWRMGEKGKAISDYEEAAHLDPESPAKTALDMTRDIMDFYNTDLFNP